MSDPVTVRDEGHVRIITLNRPEKKNAISLELAWGVIEAVRAAAADDNVWVVGLTGTGDAFCAGLDLSPDAKPYTPLTPQAAQLDDIGWVGQFVLTLRKTCDKPVVGGINGVAVGAGLGLAMACDVRLVAHSARLMAGYTRIGGSPDAGLTITLPQAMGYERAMRFMMENRTVTGEEAVAWGLAGEAVADADFPERFAAYCQSPCACSSAAWSSPTRPPIPRCSCATRSRTSASPSPARTPRRPARPSSRSARRCSRGSSAYFPPLRPLDRAATGSASAGRPDFEAARTRASFLKWKASAER